MRRSFCFRALALAAGLLSASAVRGDAADDVLWWCVTDVARIYEFRDDGVSTLAEKGVDTARIRVTGGDIADDVFLNLYAADEQGALKPSDAVYADVPGNAGAPYFAALGAYGSSEYAFSIELGAWSDADGFTGLAVGTWSYADLTPYISTEASSFAPGGVGALVFVPESFTVPEPSGGLLLLVGGALLALRRRRGCPRRPTGSRTRGTRSRSTRRSRGSATCPRRPR